MQKFMVVYRAPVEELEAWSKMDPAFTKPEEEKMQALWEQWMQTHGAMFVETSSLGKTKRVKKEGVEDTKNDLMLYSVVQGESHDAVAAAFKDHPHFGIPGASIEIMPISALEDVK